jgi:hypothetical protein
MTITIGVNLRLGLLWIVLDSRIYFIYFEEENDAINFEIILIK